MNHVADPCCGQPPEIIVDSAITLAFIKCHVCNCVVDHLSVPSAIELWNLLGQEGRDRITSKHLPTKQETWRDREPML